AAGGYTYASNEAIFNSIAAAVAVSAAGDKVSVGEGIYDESPIVINKTISIQGDGNVDDIVLQTSGTTDFLKVQAPNVIIQNLTIKKTDNATQHLIDAFGANTQILNNILRGQYTREAPDVSRGIKIAGAG